MVQLIYEADQQPLKKCWGGQQSPFTSLEVYSSSLMLIMFLSHFSVPLLVWITFGKFKRRSEVLEQFRPQCPRDMQNGGKKEDSGTHCNNKPRVSEYLVTTKLIFTLASTLFTGSNMAVSIFIYFLFFHGRIVLCVLGFSVYHHLEYRGFIGKSIKSKKTDPRKGFRPVGPVR